MYQLLSIHTYKVCKDVLILPLTATDDIQQMIFSVLLKNGANLPYKKQRRRRAAPLKAAVLPPRLQGAAAARTPGEIRLYLATCSR